MNPTTSRASRPRHTIPVYKVRLVQSRRPLRLAEETVPESGSAARVAHALIGRTDREHLACLFLNGQHHIVGAHITAVGGQHNHVIVTRDGARYYSMLERGTLPRV